ncbi:MAG: carboxymuconolactone decarboxylase family protein, partial [Coleofasciculaceae cyanobacterium]
MELTIYTQETAPENSKEALAQAKETFGFIPNLEGICAESPVFLRGCMSLWELFSQSSLSTLEQQVVHLTTSYENECHYCMAAHTGLAKKVGLSTDNIEALRNGTLLQESKLEALHQFTQSMVNKRGWVEEGEVEAFLAAGYSKQQVLEVILGIALKTMHNYTNHLAQT